MPVKVQCFRFGRHLAYVGCQCLCVWSSSTGVVESIHGPMVSSSAVVESMCEPVVSSEVVVRCESAFSGRTPPVQP